MLDELNAPVGTSDHSPGGRSPGGRSPGPRFSLSHSGARALVGISPQADIGVDIEGPREPKISGSRRDAIIAAGIALAAGAPLGGATEEQQFLQAWVRLEAIAKCSGRGMGRLLGELGIIGGGDRTSVANGNKLGPQASVRDIILDRNFCAAVAGPVADWTGHVGIFPEAHDAIAHFVRPPE